MFAYVRYKDDWVILTRSKQELRELVKRMHEVMGDLRFKLAIDKTYIGRIRSWFAFLGLRFSN